jgi:hypothetical protein
MPHGSSLPLEKDKKRHLQPVDLFHTFATQTQTKDRECAENPIKSRQDLKTINYYDKE